MSLYSPSSQAIFNTAQRIHDEAPDDLDDDLAVFLEDKPKGFCTWCGKVLVSSQFEDDGEVILETKCEGCKKWDPSEDEDSNRIRYATEQAENEERESQVYREAARRGIEL